MGLTLRNVEKKSLSFPLPWEPQTLFPSLGIPDFLSTHLGTVALKSVLCVIPISQFLLSLLFPPCHPYICSLCLLSLFLLCKWDYLHQFSWFHISVQFSPVQSLSHVRLFVTPKIAARQASLCALIKKKKLVTLVAQTVKNPPAMWETWVWSLSWENPLEEGMATHSSILAWRIPMDRGAWWVAVMGLQRVGHDWSDWATSTRNKESETSCMDLILRGGMKDSRLEAITLATSVCRFGHCCQMLKACLCQGP